MIVGEAPASVDWFGRLNAWVGSEVRVDNGNKIRKGTLSIVIYNVMSMKIVKC